MNTRTTALSLILAFTATATAGSTATYLDVATSPQGSTPAVMFHDLGVVCAGTALLRQRQTSGSLENLDLLLGNQVSMAFVQLDVLKARDQIDHDPRVKELRMLLPLNYDEIHLITFRATTTRNIFGQTTVNGVTKFSELKGKRLAVWGGSLVTANVLKAKSGVDVGIVPFKGRDDALRALQGGQVDALLAVVGQPADWVKSLDAGRYTLIPIDIPSAQMTGFYKAATLQYLTLGQGVNTYAVQRLLVTRNFKTPERHDPLVKFQQCALGRLSQLQETEGFHPKWNDVTFKESVWPWFK